MSHLKVVVTRNIGAAALDILNQQKGLNVVLWDSEDRVVEKDWLDANIKDAHGLLVVFTEKINEELVTKAGPTLKAVSTMSVGVDHVELPVLAKRGIKLGYTPNVLTDAVADISVMLALMASRNVGQAISIAQEGKWPGLPWSPFGFCGPQISTSSAMGLPTPRTITAGFLGFGRIARATLNRLIGFGVTHALYTDSGKNMNPDEEHEKKDFSIPVLRAKDFMQVARESDIVFVLTPGGKETYHLVGEEFLQAMKSTAVLINPSRGTVVDSDALAKACREGWIWGAGVDVVEGEPNVGSDHPLIKEPRCVVLPHIGSATTETRTAMARLAAENVVAGVLGQPLPAEYPVSK